MAKVKEKLFKCYFCKNKSLKGEMERIETGKKTKQGGKIFRYYHPECMKIKKQNKLKGERRTCAYVNESNEHKNGKEFILEWITKGKILIDQFGNEINVNGDFYSVESPVTKEYGKMIPYEGNTCESYFSYYDLIKYNDDKKITNLNELRSRIGYKKHKVGENQYKLHPCISCPFNRLNYKMVFDIGIGMNGKYKTAIEILNTSKVKDYKLKYCIKNNIELIEIRVDEISKCKDDDQLNCNRLWWKDENDKVHIADEYKNLNIHF